MKKILALFDCHVPFNIPLDLVWEFAQDFKPDVVILGGDICEWGSVSHWVADQSRHLDYGTLKQEYEAMKRTVLLPLSQVAPKAKKIFIPGNHERWIEQDCNRNPNLREFAELHKNIKGWKILAFNESYKAGSNLVYIHGLYTNKYHAHKTAEAFVGKSVRYGHVHTMQSFTNISPVDSKHFYQAQSIGCLCTLNPHFMENQPNAWVNGFDYCYLNDDGTFHPFPIIIVKGKFWAEGRFYK